MATGISVAIITYLLTRKTKRSDNAKSFLEQKLTFFGSLLFQFDRMRFTHDSVESRKMNFRDEEHPNTERYSYSSKEGESIFADINDTIKKNYSLFSQDLMRE